MLPGIVPQSWFLDKSSETNDFRLPMSFGIVPVNSLLDRFNPSNPGRFVSSSGMLPFKLLPDRSIFTKYNSGCIGVFYSLYDLLDTVVTVQVRPLEHETYIFRRSHGCEVVYTVRDVSSIMVICKVHDQKIRQ